MRPVTLATTLLSALAISATAHAAPPSFENFSFSLDGGPPITFSLDPSALHLFLNGDAAVYDDVDFSDGSLGNILGFSEPAFEQAFSLGPIDFSLQSASGMFFFDGPQLYSGLESDPIFIPGTYHLTGDAGAGTSDILTLVISSPVPEPSSLPLFATGVMGCAGIVRRRFLKA